jgi:hydroxyacylglutathione hydrolase
VLKEGDRVKVGARELSVIETPGHAGGHLAFVMSTGDRTHLFCGDSLFFDGKLALQGLPDCNLQESLRSIRKLSTLSVDAFLPGHLCISLSDGQRHVLAAEEIIAALGVPGNIA